MLSTPESVNTIFVKENSLLIIKIIYVSLIKLKELCLLLSILLLLVADPRIARDKFFFRVILLNIFGVISNNTLPFCLY